MPHPLNYFFVCKTNNNKWVSVEIEDQQNKQIRFVSGAISQILFAWKLKQASSYLARQFNYSLVYIHIAYKLVDWIWFDLIRLNDYINMCTTQTQLNTKLNFIYKAVHVSVYFCLNQFIRNMD